MEKDKVNSNAYPEFSESPEATHETSSGQGSGLGSGEESGRGEVSMETSEEASAVEPQTEKPTLEDELQELKDKYLRLYAEFENYKKRTIKDKEELLRYGNESLLYELLTVIDNLEMAMKHSGRSLEQRPSSNDVSAGLVQGVEITFKEFLRIIERFGVVPINALGKGFDPSVHHAMTHVEKDDVDENTVVEEFRKGYMFNGKVLRPSLVAVSKKTVNSSQLSVISQENTEENIEEGDKNG